MSKNTLEKLPIELGNETTQSVGKPLNNLLVPLTVNRFLALVILLKLIDFNKVLLKLGATIVVRFLSSSKLTEVSFVILLKLLAGIDVVFVGNFNVAALLP